MFQAGGLIFFCGLLALPLPVELASSPTNLIGNLTSALSSGLFSEGLLNTITNLPLLDILKNSGRSSNNPLSSLLQYLIPGLNPLKGIVDINITDPKILTVGLVPSEDGRRLFLNIPLNLVLNVQVPALKTQLIKLFLKLNTTVEIFPVKDENNETHLVVGDCTHPLGKLEATLPAGSNFPLAQRIADSITNILNKIIPQLVQGMACPIVNEVLSYLDVTQVQQIINTLIPATSIILSI